MKVEIVRTAVVHEAERIERADDRPAIGSWWWVSDKDEKTNDRKGQWLACVTEVGSNYADVEGMRYTERIALDDFHTKCQAAPDYQEFLDGKVDQHRGEVRLLMGKIKEICHKLGVPFQHALATSEAPSTALAVAHGVADVKKYKNALVKAKEKTLPELFEKVKEQHEQMAKWMKAELIPAKAELNRAKETTEIIEQKIHTVELYAGLQEDLVQVREGKAAALDAKVYLMQRRHYMDEECLAKYEAGGMDFENLGYFDKWIARDENMFRLLPHDRCILAFRIRRWDKDYGVGDSLARYIKFQFHNKHNKQTFLYIRNGHQLWRMATDIEFSEELFPNQDDSSLLGNRELWYNPNASPIELITSESRAGMIDYWKLKRRLMARALWQWHNAGKPKDEWTYTAGPEDTTYQSSWEEGTTHRQHGRPHRYEWDMRSPAWKGYHRLTPESVYFDDAMKRIGQVAFEHNRVAVVVQGLLDRSTCLHPHPPWKIWTPEGFTAGIELVYDVSRAIAPGEIPDWDGYFKQLQKSVRVGAFVRGHRERWVDDMQNQYGEREWRWRAGNGPNTIARVEAIRGGKACFKFTRERRKGIRYTEPVPGEPGWVYNRVNENRTMMLFDRDFWRALGIIGRVIVLAFFPWLRARKDREEASGNHSRGGKEFI